MAVKTLGKSKETESKKQGLTKSDRCDAACPAQALVMVRGISGELLFCAHHYNKIISNESSKLALDSFAFEVIDERDSISDKRAGL